MLVIWDFKDSVNGYDGIRIEALPWPASSAGAGNIQNDVALPGDNRGFFLTFLMGHGN